MVGRGRNRGVFKVVSAVILLMLYISTMLAGDVVALTCRCCHHGADVHTDFRHEHKCTSAQCEHEQHSHESETATISEHHECHHNHSNEVELYIQPRLDDGVVRQNILLAVLMEKSVEIISPEKFLSFAYKEYSLPALSAGYGGRESLRAPPAIV